MYSTKLKTNYVTIFLILLSTIVFSQTYVAGNTYYDSTGYIEYRAGNIPIILSAPHGGSLKPSSIPDRDCTGCVYNADSYTQEITDGVYNSFVAKTGCYPHVIINKLHRIKLDANRDIDDAADGNATPIIAWNNYHSFIESAKTKVELDYGKGLFLDIHGQSHAHQKIEVGYLLSGSDLRLSDTSINGSTRLEKSSIISLVNNNVEGYSHAELVRGTFSFGTMLTSKGFPSVPSLPYPAPSISDSYFTGGYNTVRHGSRDNDGGIDAIQLELNSDVRFNSTSRSFLIISITDTAIEYIDKHYNTQFVPEYCNSILGISEQKKNNSSKFKIYPNPAKSYFNLETDVKDVEVKIYNNLGKLVHSEVSSNNQIKIDFLSNGYYFVTLKKGHTVLANMKLMKF